MTCKLAPGTGLGLYLSLRLLKTNSISPTSTDYVSYPAPTIASGTLRLASSGGGGSTTLQGNSTQGQVAATVRFDLYIVVVVVVAFAASWLQLVFALPDPDS